MSDNSAETKTIKLATGRTIVIQELDGLEQIQADQTANTDNQLPIVYFRAAASLVSIDGELFPRAFDAISLKRKLQKLKGRESDELAKEYTKAFTNFSADELGNELPAESSQPNS